MDRGEVLTKGILAVTPLVGIICSDMEQAVIWISFFMGNLTNVNLPVQTFRANNTEHYYITRGGLGIGKNTDDKAHVVKIFRNNYHFCI